MNGLISSGLPWNTPQKSPIFEERFNETEGLFQWNWSPISMKLSVKPIETPLHSHPFFCEETIVDALIKAVFWDNHKNIKDLFKIIQDE